jgi:hypothetical protein
MGSMEKIITALAPIFAAGFAVQQLLEILTSYFDLDSKKLFQNYKKPILGTVAFVLGLALAAEVNTGVLNILKGSPPDTRVGLLDFIVTALIISAGTEGVNSILKFLKYSKEDKKREAAGLDPKSAPADGGALPTARLDGIAAGVAMPGATEAALARINRQ